jgi:hypothetical protein
MKQWHLISQGADAAIENSRVLLAGSLKTAVAITPFPRYISIQLIA